MKSTDRRHPEPFVEGGAADPAMEIYNEARTLAHGKEGWDHFYVMVAKKLKDAEAIGWRAAFAETVEWVRLAEEGRK